MSIGNEPAWEVRFSRTRGRPYFFDSQNNESTWDAPELSAEEINQLPGAKYLRNDRGVDHPEQSGADDHAERVRASHLLVKHQGSRRPSSWKEANITRTKEEATRILEEYQAQIDGSETAFAALATAHSDCSSYRNGGDLGWFIRGQMQKPFEDATFALEVGQISNVIHTDSGAHLILRTG